MLMVYRNNCEKCRTFSRITSPKSTFLVDYDGYPANYRPTEDPLTPCFGHLEEK